MNVQNIREHLPVIASCGQRIGTVDRVEGCSIKLTKSWIAITKKLMMTINQATSRMMI